DPAEHADQGPVLVRVRFRLLDVLVDQFGSPGEVVDGVFEPADDEFECDRLQRYRSGFGPELRLKVVAVLAGLVEDVDGLADEVGAEGGLEAVADARPGAVGGGAHHSGAAFPISRKAIPPL